MSSNSRKGKTKIAPQLAGIALLAGVFMSGVRSESLPQETESPLQHASRRLRVRMTSAEVDAITHDLSRLRPAMASTAFSFFVIYYDREHGDWLSLCFAHNGMLEDKLDMRLVGSTWRHR